MSSNVYVINHNDHPLMPCKPAKARKLLRDGKASVVHRSPFTIKLLWDCEERVQEVTLGIDKGSHVTGFCCVGKGQILLSGEIQHRQDVKDKMDGRRTNRRNRRNRKWYRAKRFVNRASSKRSGRLPPSIVIEDVQVDIARLNTPNLAGSQYQDRTRLDENLRMACLMRDGYTCQHCGKQSDPERDRGEWASGSDRATHDARQKLLYATLGAHTPLSTLFGYQTATLRKGRGLPKRHDADALCIATYDTDELVPYDREHFYLVLFRPRRTRRQYHDLPRKGRGESSIK